MDRSAIFWAGRLFFGVIGVVLMFAAVRLLGRARAAANWPTAPPVGIVARPVAYLGIGLGLLGLAAAAALSLGALVAPDTTFAPRTWRVWLVALGGGIIVIGIGAAATGRLVERAELTALIRIPPRPADDGPADSAWLAAISGAPGIEPVVPPGGRSGWVYRDPAGDWYLAVASEAGQRLVRLPDFTLVPVGHAGSPLTLEGSVELSVWPVEERPAVG